MSRPIITLTTDYGTMDHFVGAMKGVVLTANPEAEVHDISHSVLPYDILDGALAIAQAAPYFPPNTIHIVVVDPGVGTERRPILVRGDLHYFIAPDNGVLSVIYEQQETLSVRHITSEHYFRTPVSNTFHGRDIFAPVAGWLSKNWQPASFGEEIEDFVRLTVPKPRAEGNVVRGLVLRVDHFGNLITNLTPDGTPQLSAGDGKFKIRVGSGEITRFVQHFAQGAAGEIFALVGSSGYVELAMNRASAARTLGAGRGAEVVVEPA